MREIAGLWTCPKCGRKLVGRNMFHSCTDATVEQFLRRASARTRALYAKLESLIAACGPYHVSPAKTRIAFMGRVRFAGVTAIDERSMTIAFTLPEPLASLRFRTVEEVAPGWWAHRLHIGAARELDRELQGWLRESYRLMGMQERLTERSRAKARRKKTSSRRPRRSAR
jgi:hypothetical protein